MYIFRDKNGFKLEIIFTHDTQCLCNIFYLLSLFIFLLNIMNAKGQKYSY